MDFLRFIKIDDGHRPTVVADHVGKSFFSGFEERDIHRPIAARYACALRSLRNVHHGEGIRLKVGDQKLRTLLRERHTLWYFTDRNIRMVDRIDAKLKKGGKSFFFAVGALHYPGEDGMLKLLEKKGYTITRLLAKDAGTLPKKGESKKDEPTSKPAKKSEGF